MRPGGSVVAAREGEERRVSGIVGAREEERLGILEIVDGWGVGVFRFVLVVGTMTGAELERKVVGRWRGLSPRIEEEVGRLRATGWPELMCLCMSLPSRSRELMMRGMPDLFYVRFGNGISRSGNRNGKV